MNLTLECADDKTYTFILKDDVGAWPDPENERERATLSWEYDFNVMGGGEARSGPREGKVIFIPWEHFRPTYRGKEKEREGSKGIDLKAVRRMSLMMRRYA